MKGLYLLVVAVLVGIASGCSQDTPCRLVDEPPTACFTISIEHPYPALCPQLLTLVFDASCSSDDNTGSDSLLVRWDFDNDGAWDTVYGPVLQEKRYTGVLCGPRLWSATCEVLDCLGQPSRFATSVDLGPRPVEPDLIANHVWLERDADGATMDTLRVGEPFRVNFSITICGYTGHNVFSVRFLRDGVTFYQSQRDYETTSCSGFGEGGFVVDAPGDYIFTVIVDADNAILETDETNNSASAGLRVGE